MSSAESHCFCGAQLLCVDWGVAQRPANDSSRVMFRQGKSVLDSTFAHNAMRMDSIVEPLRTLLANPQRYRVSEINITGGASPEGSVALNNALSARRAAVAAEYLRNAAQVPDSILHLSSVGRDWRGLLLLAEADTLLPSRQAVVGMLRDFAMRNADGLTDLPGTLGKLQTLEGGAPYRYMYARLFPQLRAARMDVVYNCLLPEMLPEMFAAVPPGAAVEMNWDAPLARWKPTLPAQPRPFYMALKTNLLYDALAVPNISAEFYIGKQWSVVGSWMYAWWSKDSAHRYWRIYGGDVAVRRWFGKASRVKPLTGHHLGAYAGVVTYDFEFGGKGYMGGIPGGTLWDRCQYMVGIEYGYSLPIASRLNLDFTIGIGYRQGKCVRYTPEDKWYVWKSTRMERRFGPTKAEISLVWLLGRGNRNIRKGGAK